MSSRFTSPPNPAAYNALVWEIARQIPSGKVCTYGQLAAMIPPPAGMTLRDYEAFGARWVGGAMASCPDDVPWQRVINSQGKISLRKGEGPSLQRGLLEQEGVRFDEHSRVDFSIYRWEGPSEEWRKAHGLAPSSPTGASQMKMPL